MEWQNPVVPWWVWHRYSSHPSSDNDHANFLDMLISMDVCYSIFNIQTYHVGMNYGKLESMVAWKYLWYSDENDHYWYQSGRNPLMKSLAILVVSCYMFLFSRSFVNVVLVTPESYIIQQLHHLHLPRKCRIQYLMFYLASHYLFPKICSIHEGNFITDRYCKR